MTQKIPTIITSSGIRSISRTSRAGVAAKMENSMNAVALVGPSIVCLDPANRGATMAATEALMIP